MNTSDFTDNDPDMMGRTIIDSSFLKPSGLKSFVLDQGVHQGVIGETVQKREFKIRLADSEGRRNAASLLIQKMYSWRGYVTGKTTLPPTESPSRITLVASNENGTLGTLSLGLDSPTHGLLVDGMYKAEVDELRLQKRKVCELTKLAVDTKQGSKWILASLFHIAYVYGRQINCVDDVFIEVNPRHEPFYRRMLGFERVGPQKMCERVNAPAVLLRLQLAFVDAQIERYGGRSELSKTTSSLYPYFFSKKEELGIRNRVERVG
jgi:hypothetical protein